MAAFDRPPGARSGRGLARLLLLMGLAWVAGIAIVATLEMSSRSSVVAGVRWAGDRDAPPRVHVMAPASLPAVQLSAPLIDAWLVAGRRWAPDRHG